MPPACMDVLQSMPPAWMRSSTQSGCAERFVLQKRAFQKAQAEKQAKEQAEYEANLKRVEETKARAEEAKAIQAAKVAAAAEARAAKDAAKGMAQASGKGDSSKSEKYAVQTVNARAERIAARKAAGEEAPTFFGIGQ
mmetsp:Transcript_25086/g.58486  ORF Transcript_25086/g.58486 Transcript_25086/m.58486 type:complete len:138 (-) Transcript_25086:350-763(-)